MSKGSARVYRGGSWSHYAWDCRAAFRYWGAPSGRDGFLGVRLVIIPANYRLLLDLANQQKRSRLG